MQRFLPRGDELARALVALVVLSLIGADIIHASGWDWRDWFSPKALTGNGEIRNYVEFVHVVDGDLEIITGIQFDSSLRRKITKQWCYVEPENRTQGETIYRLELDRLYAGRPPVPVTFDPEALQRFRLTAAEASALTKQKCRFQPMED